jgi:hypothetical protein
MASDTNDDAKTTRSISITVFSDHRTTPPPAPLDWKCMRTGWCLRCREARGEPNYARSHRSGASEKLRCREPLSCGVRKTLELRCPENLELQCRGTLELQCPGTLELRYPGTLELRYPGTLELRYPETLSKGAGEH